MNSPTFDVNGLLSAIAKKVWEQENLSGEVLNPTLSDIQETVVSTPRLHKDLNVASTGTKYRVLISCENLDEGYKHFPNAQKFFRPDLDTVEHGFEDKVISASADAILILNEQEHLAKCLELFSRHILRTAGEPSMEQAQWLQKIWKKEKDHNKELEHPLTPIVRAWIQEQTSTRITPEHDRKYPIGVLKYPGGSVRELAFTENDTGQVFQVPERYEQVQIELDLGNKEQLLPAIMPLQVVQSSDMKSQTKSGAVSHELRIFHEAMMALKPNHQRGYLIFHLGDLIEYLYPNGKFNWTNQLPHIERALAVLHNSATIPWIDDQGSIRQWRPVTVRAPLPHNATRDTPILMDVLMPPDARRGHMVIKNIHRLTAMKSAARWNAYHVACYLWDKYGTVKGKLVDPTRPVEKRDNQNRLVDATGKPLVTRNGKEIKNPYHKEAIPQLEREPNPDTIQRYPILSNEDLILACLPNGYPKNNRRTYLKRAKAHWEALEIAGYIIIHKEITGWRILPPSEHLNAHRALRKASKSIY